MNNFYDQDPYQPNNELLQNRISSSFHSIAEWLILHGEHTEDTGQENMHIFCQKLSSKIVRDTLISQEEKRQFSEKGKDQLIVEGGEISYQGGVLRDGSSIDEVAILWAIAQTKVRTYMGANRIIITRINGRYETSFDSEYSYGVQQQTLAGNVDRLRRPVGQEDITKIEAFLQELSASNQSS